MLSSDLCTSQSRMCHFSRLARDTDWVRVNWKRRSIALAVVEFFGTVAVDIEVTKDDSELWGQLQWASRSGNRPSNKESVNLFLRLGGGRWRQQKWVFCWGSVQDTCASSNEQSTGKEAIQQMHGERLSLKMTSSAPSREE